MEQKERIGQGGLTMEAEDLMKGDWVYNTHNQQNEQVQEITGKFVMLNYNDLYEYDEVEPIPLTPEILRKNGLREDRKDITFRLREEHGDAADYMDIHFSPLSGNSTRIVVEHYTGDMRRVDIGDCAYVHELQQAMRLAGIKKEIVL